VLFAGIPTKKCVHVHFPCCPLY